MALSRSVDASEIQEALFRRRVQLADGFEATIENRFRTPTDADLRTRTGLLAISVKNRRFSNALVAAFCRASQERFAAGVVTVVDSPYERNVAAGCGTPDQQRREIETLRRVAAEARVRVDRIVARHGGGAVSIQPWDALAAEVPEWLARGIRAAWERRGRFHADVLAQSRAILPNAPASVVLECYAEFLLEELPVLLHHYYFRPDEVVDVYPGPQPAVFWRIEAGAYADEMPDFAGRLCPRTGLIYACVGPRIRPMRPTELEAVVCIWRRSQEQVQPWREGRMDGSAGDHQRHFRDVVARHNEVWLAVEDGQILGFLALAGTRVNHLHVDPAAQRRGVGTALLERAKTLSPKGITASAHPRDKLARAFYARRGFREVRRAVRALAESGSEVELAWEPRGGGGGPSLPSA